MFTGIIEDVGKVISVEKTGSSGKITVAASLDLKAVRLGDSIAVNGACLTVVAKGERSFAADVSEETFSSTTLGALKTGDAVNVESALKLGSPVGGHLVTGHVDGAGAIERLERSAAFVELGVTLPQALLAQVVKKGSIAIDGISLTIADVTDKGFIAAVIPHTLERTTLRFKKPGDAVNIETDIIGKYVERFLKGYKTGGVTEGFLREHGFMKEF